MGFTIATPRGGLFGTDFDLTFEERQGITPGDGLFMGGPEEEEEELQGRPSPEQTLKEFAIDDCGPDDPLGPLGNVAIDDCGPTDPLGPLGTLAIDDCGPGDPLPDFTGGFDTIV
ncbi:MAG: hypothetical protein AcusKO_27790 [Acuticoccus sp.]